jgi:hypothetical protein
MPEMMVDLPVMVAFDVQQGDVVRLPTLAGTRVAVVDNGWTSMDVMFPEFERRLRELGVTEITRWKTPNSRPAADETLDDIAAHADAAIVGLGN